MKLLMIHLRYDCCAVMLLCLLACSTVGCSSQLKSDHVITAQRDAMLSAGTSGKQFEANQLLVQFSADIPATKARAAIIAQGGRVVREIKAMQVYHVLLPVGNSLMDELERYRRIRGVIFAEASYRRPVRNSNVRE